MHLSKFPTVFVKGGEERKAFFTIQAKELIAAGWVEKGTEKKVSEPVAEAKEEPKVEEKPKARRVAKKKTEES
tara:strand:+ start:341 stop:559 length:219 start_codon:yes stop_codon:yes gene_type:complete